MTFTVTGNDLLVLILVLLAIAVGVYLLIVLKNANRLITNVNKTVSDNQERLEHLIEHLEEISGNTAQFSDSLMHHYRDNEVLVNTMIKTGAESICLINDTTSRIKTLIRSFNDIVSSLSRAIKKFS